MSLSRKLIWGAIIVLGVGLRGYTLILAWKDLPATLSSLRLGDEKYPVEPYMAPGVTPPLGSGEKLADGVKLYKVTLARSPAPSHLWIYLPEKPVGPLPCVLIAPAGSPLFHGMELDRSDQPEHIPYVKAGYAVVAYDIDGPVAPGAHGAAIVRAAYRFQSAYAGVENAKTALDYALAHIPNIDKAHIYTAGHSSAATVSLLVAEHEPRIAGCIAYAPGIDSEAWVGPKLINALTVVRPNYRAFMHDYSAINATATLGCPTFIFHALDDEKVTTPDIARFVTKLKQTNPNVTLMEVPQGGHYESMIKAGIPAAIEWLAKQHVAAGARPPNVSTSSTVHLAP